uniref:Uncharacterized protein n=1 Tax=Amorphochlora amoebiformis TaxID=1561963 RepID=A0A7S0CZN8_9EUKA
MGDDTRFCGRPVRTLTLWFTLFDILIGVIGLAIMPIFIQERSQIYIGYAGLALAYYLFSIIFASIGFYGAYRIKRCHLTTLVVWLCFSFIFFFASYIAAIVTVRSTCDKMWIEVAQFQSHTRNNSYAVHVHQWYVISDTGTYRTVTHSDTDRHACMHTG